jgi:hypothetical protein
MFTLVKGADHLLRCRCVLSDKNLLHVPFHGSQSNQSIVHLYIRWSSDFRIGQTPSPLVELPYSPFERRQRKAPLPPPVLVPISAVNTIAPALTRLG